MNTLWILVIILIVAAPFALWFLVVKPNRKKKAQDAVTAGVGIPNVPDRWENSDRTNLGASVYWNGNVFNTDEEKRLVFECLDVGFTNCFNASKDVFPTWDYNPALIMVGILEPTATNLDGSKALKTKGGVQIAGAVIGVDDGYPIRMILIPSQKENGWRYTDLVMRTAWHEREHDDEARSDTNEYYKWGRTPEFPVDAHPHRPLPQGVPEIPAPTPINAVRSLAKIAVKFVCGTKV